MEFIGTFTLFIICPLLGLYMLVTGIYKYVKTKKIKKFLFGLFILSLPFLYAVMFKNQQKNYEQSVVGDYAFEGDTLTVLSIYGDGYFKLDTLQDLSVPGKGTWKVYQGDLVELVLHMPARENNNSLRFEVDKRGNKATLTYNSWRNMKLIEK
jgi:hypothetical protein